MDFCLSKHRPRRAPTSKRHSFARLNSSLKTLKMDLGRRGDLRSPKTDILKVLPISRLPLRADALANPSSSKLETQSKQAERPIWTLPKGKGKPTWPLLLLLRYLPHIIIPPALIRPPRPILLAIFPRYHFFCPSSNFTSFLLYSLFLKALTLQCWYHSAMFQGKQRLSGEQAQTLSLRRRLNRTTPSHNNQKSKLKPRENPSQPLYSTLKRPPSFFTMIRSL